MFITDMSDKENMEEERLDVAAGGITAEECKLLEALRALKIKPNIDSPSDVRKLSKVFSDEEQMTPAGRPKTGPRYSFNAEFRTAPKPSPRKPKLENMYSAVTPSVSASQVDIPIVAPRSFNFPKMSTFFGEEGRGDVSWPTFKYEVESLLNEGLY